MGKVSCALNVHIGHCFGLSGKRTFVKAWLRSEGGKQIEFKKTTGVSGTHDPVFDQELMFRSAPSNGQLFFEIVEEIQPDDENAKKKRVEQVVIGTALLDLSRHGMVRDQEVHRKLVMKDGVSPLPGLLFFEYTLIPETPGDNFTCPLGRDIDCNDAGQFCGHVYAEVVDAIDLNADHVILAEMKASNLGGGEIDENVLNQLAADYRWHSRCEIACVKQQGHHGQEPFRWMSAEAEDSASPSWNDGVEFPIDFRMGEKLPGITFTIRNGADIIGSTRLDMSIVPGCKLQALRIFSEDLEVRGYVVVRIAFVPLGRRVEDLPVSMDMDDRAIKDFLGMRRKYEMISRENMDLAKACDDLQKRVDELEGKGADWGEAASKEQKSIMTKAYKGPAVPAMYHAFCYLAEPWSKGSRIASTVLVHVLENALKQDAEIGRKSKAEYVHPLLRGIAPGHYLTFKEYSLVLKQLELTKKEWSRVVKYMRQLDLSTLPRPSAPGQYLGDSPDKNAMIGGDGSPKLAGLHNAFSASENYAARDPPAMRPLSGRIESQLHWEGSPKSRRN